MKAEKNIVEQLKDSFCERLEHKSFEEFFIEAIAIMKRSRSVGVLSILYGEISRYSSIYGEGTIKTLQDLISKEMDMVIWIRSCRTKNFIIEKERSS